MPFPKTFAELKENGYQFSGHATCRACGADIEWWITPKKSKMPMDVVLDLRDSTPITSHWATCPEADRFRR